MGTINYENIALLHLMNQDTKALSLKELYVLYCETIEQVKETAKEYHKKNGEHTYSFE